MSDNGRMQQAKDVLRRCNISVLTESEFSRTYTNIRREPQLGRSNYTGYRPSEVKGQANNSHLLKSLGLD